MRGPIMEFVTTDLPGRNGPDSEDVFAAEIARVLALWTRSDSRYPANMVGVDGIVVRRLSHICDAFWLAHSMANQKRLAKKGSYASYALASDQLEAYKAAVEKLLRIVSNVETTVEKEHQPGHASDLPLLAPPAYVAALLAAGPAPRDQLEALLAAPAPSAPS